jgi:hypothetical protein
VRVQVLNDDWEERFHHWYPNFRPVQMEGIATPLIA